LLEILTTLMSPGLIVGLPETTVNEVAGSSFIWTVDMVVESVPTFFMVRSMYAVSSDHLLPVISNCSVFIKVNVSPPIQAAIAMDTATVMAMSMMPPITELSPLLLLLMSYIVYYYSIHISSGRRKFITTQCAHAKISLRQSSVDKDYSLP